MLLQGEACEKTENVRGAGYSPLLKDMLKRPFAKLRAGTRSVAAFDADSANYVGRRMISADVKAAA